MRGAAGGVRVVGVLLASLVVGLAPAACGSAPNEAATSPSGESTSATTLPTASPTDSPAGAPSATPTAAPPATPYALDGTIHVGSRTVTVPEGRVTALAVLADDRLLVRTAPEGERSPQRWVVLASDGAVVTDLGQAAVAIASPDGTMIVVKDDLTSGSVEVLDPDGGTVAEREVGSARPNAVVGGRVLLVGDAGRELWDVATGAVTRLPDGSGRLSADGRYAMGVTGHPLHLGEEVCWFLVDLTRSTSTKSLERCAEANPEFFSPYDLSPDGRWLLGESFSDGGFFYFLAVVDARDGHVVVGRTSMGDAVNGWSWAFDADGETFLFSRNPSDPPYPALRNDLVRCTLDMDCTEVAAPVSTILVPNSGYTLPRYVVGRPLLSTATAE